MSLVVTTEQVHTFFEVQPTYCEKEYISCSKKVKQQFDSVLQQHYWCPHEESGTLQWAGDTVIEMRQRQSFQSRKKKVKHPILLASKEKDRLLGY